MILEQIRSSDGTGTLSYLVGDEEARTAILIDPNIEDTERIVEKAKQLDVRITSVIDTHTHADHISGAGELKKRFGATLLMHEKTKEKWKRIDEGDRFGIGEILRANAAFEVNRFLKDDDLIEVGGVNFRTFYTPGHTDNHVSVLFENNLFTGDLLLIGQAGRSDLPGGNPEEQYDSLFNKVLPLPDDTKVWPGHDYEGNSFSTLRQEKERNPFLKKRSKEEYLDFISEYFPPFSDMAEGGKVILQCGTRRVATSDEPFRSINPSQLSKMILEDPSLFLLDVRQPFELTAFGAIPGIVNIPTREVPRRLNDLPAEKSKAIVVVCQTGSRSYEIAHYLAKQGYTNVFSLEGGTGGWVQGRHRVE